MGGEMAIASVDPVFRFRMPDLFTTESPDMLNVLRVVFEGTSNAILVADEQGAILYANAAAAGIFHYVPEGLLGLPASHLFSSVGAHSYAAPDDHGLPRALESLESQTVEGLRSDGVVV